MVKGKIRGANFGEATYCVVLFVIQDHVHVKGLNDHLTIALSFMRKWHSYSTK